jgi:eukaryotic-like serine/threonine-protein kinase
VSGERWDRIQQVFLDIVDLPVSERDAVLTRECGGDVMLRLEVESLLKADTVGEGAIATAIGAEVSALLEDHAPLIGARVGSYRLLREIGRGGMGSVYLGERDDEHYQKLVAIKVVKRGMDSAEVLARFRHERQILAGLEHPYIARLIDGGTTSDGRPFFVMEYVQGLPIDAYCREQGLDLASRLKLFLRVCEAVAYAHRSLVVHRDLKPSNILVTAEGVPKLLDFGVAKLLDPGVDPGLTANPLAMGPLTPEYASPEQIQGLPITTSADVYALGLILFELLTGTRAQKIPTYSPTEIERVICHTDPPRPSTVPRGNGAPAKLNTDLDTIVLMAMRKESARRYESVHELAEDVERSMDGRPIRARKDSAYRAGKFVRRHAVAVFATVLVLLSLVGGIAVALKQAHEAEKARIVAEAQRQSAELERARAEAQTKVAERERERAEAETQLAKIEQDRSQRRLGQMLELADRSLFDIHSAIEKLPGSTEPRRQVVATTLTFLENLSKDADQDDRLRFMLAVSYFKVANVQGYPLQPNLGETKEALANYERSMQFIEPLLRKEPNRPEYILQSVETQTSWATTLGSAGEEEQALPMMLAALPTAHRLNLLCPKQSQCLMAEGGVYSELVNMTLNHDSSASLHYSQLQIESLQHAMKALPDAPEIQLELATAYSQQAKIDNVLRDLPRSVEQYRQAIALREGALQRNPSDVILRRSLMITYGNLGGTLGNPLYNNLGDTAGAREYYAKALAIARDLARADANDQLAQYDLANALLFSSILDPPKEEWPAALVNLQEAERILHKIVAADPQSNSKLRTLATVEEYEGHRLNALGRMEEALTEYRLSLAASEKAIARSPLDLGLAAQILASEGALAEALAEQGDRNGAVEMAQRATSRAEKLSTGASDPDRIVRLTALAYGRLARVRATLKDWSDARAAAQHSLTLWRQLTAKSPSLDTSEVTRIEALVKDCDTHL